MKLSIITINFNDAKGLEKTIQSVINQTFKDFEYIVVDGASTDGSVDVIHKYADKLTHWVSEPDTGIYNAMNKGTRMASGEYCLYLNSGDFLAGDDVLEMSMNYRFNEDVVSCKCLDYNEKHEWLRNPPSNVSLFTFVHGTLPHPTTFIKRELIIRLGGYNENYRIMSDWCFFLEAMIIHQCSYRTIDVLLTKFNCFGISSTSCVDDSIGYLKEKFPRIMDDYKPYDDEAIYNVLYWLHGYPKIRALIILPFKIINRLFKLRNRLGKRMGVFYVGRHKSSDN